MKSTAVRSITVARLHALLRPDVKEIAGTEPSTLAGSASLWVNVRGPGGEQRLLYSARIDLGGESPASPAGIARMLLNLQADEALLDQILEEVSIARRMIAGDRQSLEKLQRTW